jgi:hypothetical protein
MKIKTLMSLVALAMSAVLAGCATAPPTKAMLTYKTVPEGAELFEAGKSIGVAPVTRTYESDGKSRSITTPDVTAVWPSGAKTSYFTYLDVGADLQATLERPASAPNLQADLDRAKTVAATRQREADRLRTLQKKDIAQASERCKAQQRGEGLALADDCS